MFKNTTADTNGTNPEISQSPDGLAREGARRMISGALELEVEEYLSRVQHLRDEQGQTAAVRSGKARERTIQMGAGSIKIRAAGEDWGREREGGVS
jgi:hypothetical protein